MALRELAPVLRQRITTRDVEEGTEVLRTLYATHTPSFATDGSAYLLRIESETVETSRGALRVDRLRNAARGTASVDPAANLLLMVRHAGSERLATTTDRTTGPVFLVPHWSECDCVWDDLDSAVGMLDLDGVRRLGGELAGIEPDTVAFTGMNPVSPVLGRYAASVRCHVERDLVSDDDMMASPLIRSEAFRLLATAVLAAFPNTTHTLTPPSGSDGAQPAVVRRALEFMDAHAQEDIDITRIAEASRISPRGLQAAFKRYRDQTPLEYLRRVRMEGAHRDLRSADPTQGDSVAAVAARWGFAHPGRFSVEYRGRYGCSPSQTLRH